MTQPIHTPGPASVTGANQRAYYPQLRIGNRAIDMITDNPDADGRLLAAAYNAFDSAARALNCNAVELAEAMQDGAFLTEVLASADSILYNTPHLDRAAFENVTAVLAKLNGGAS